MFSINVDADGGGSKVYDTPDEPKSELGGFVGILLKKEELSGKE